jgi:hypothetical protein
MAWQVGTPISGERAVLTHVMVDRDNWFKPLITIRAQMDPRIFISYSHKDGSQFAASLRQQLLERNFSIRQDIVALEGVDETGGVKSTVSPVRGPGVDDVGKLPRWLGQIYDLDLTEHYTTLIRVLQDQSRQKRVAMMAPESPTDFVERPAEFDALCACSRKVAPIRRD